MGMSDQKILPRYKDYIRQLIKLGVIKNKNVKIAWLGQQDPEQSPSGNIVMYDNLSSLFFDSCVHEFFDIENTPVWDVNNDWAIKDYDIVISFRLNYLIPSVTHMLKETKKVVDNNDVYITDFCSGNVNSSIMTTISWNEESSNLIAFLPEYWQLGDLDGSKFKPVAEEDNLLTKQKIDDQNLAIHNFASFRCPKQRHYIICTMEKK